MKKEFPIRTANSDCITKTLINKRVNPVNVMSLRSIG